MTVVVRTSECPDAFLSLRMKDHRTPSRKVGAKKGGRYVVEYPGPWTMGQWARTFELIRKRCNVPDDGASVALLRDGSAVHYLDGRLHRTDGPAIESGCGGWGCWGYPPPPCWVHGRFVADWQLPYLQRLEVTPETTLKWIDKTIAIAGGTGAMMRLLDEWVAMYLAGASEEMCEQWIARYSACDQDD